jgi:hypothetical protein
VLLSLWGANGRLSGRIQRKCGRTLHIASLSSTAYLTT